MLFSIVTVNLNNAAGLERTLQSIAVQSYAHPEIIVIDGGSTDGSTDVIKRFENIITKWVNEKDSGIYNAMNKGIVRAAGQYVIFMNSGDTFYSAETLQKVSTDMDNHDIIYGNAWVVDRDRSWLEIFPPRLSLSFMASKFLCHQAIFYKREMLISMGGYNEEYKIFADWDFNVRALFLNGFSHKHLDVTICNFDRTGLSSMSDTIKEEFVEVKSTIMPLAAWQELEEAYFAGRRLYLLKNSRLLKMISLLSAKLRSTIYR